MEGRHFYIVLKTVIPIILITIFHMRIKILPVITLLFVAIIMVISGCTKEYKEATTVTDVDGNVYDIVKIGNQEWLGSNLNVRHYRNGEALPNGLVAANTRKAGAWTYYGNSGKILALSTVNYIIHMPYTIQEVWRPKDGM